MKNRKKVFVLGMARSGYEVSKFLLQNNYEVFITDGKEQNIDHVNELLSLGANFQVITSPEELLDETYDVLIQNPGIKSDHKCISKARELGIEVTTEIDFVYSYLPKDVKVIGITGSNGKTTVTTLIYEIIKRSSYKVHLGGNIGIPFAKIISDVKDGDVLVLEISSHQLLHFNNFKTDISVLTNITETHIDFFETYENYKNQKYKIFNHHTGDNIAIINRDDKESMIASEKIPSKINYFSTKKEANIYLKENDIYYFDEFVINKDEIFIKGNHNVQNAMCAIAVAKELGISNEIIREVLTDFKGVEHRCEFVRNLNNREFYNDSKSTNVIATEMALSAFKKPVILLLGGLDRGHSFEPLTEHLKYVKYVVAYGETKNRIFEYAKSINKEVSIFDTLEEATLFAYQESQDGDVILLSPACASWDQYPSFEHRGNLFKEIVNNLD